MYFFTYGYDIIICGQKQEISKYFCVWKLRFCNSKLKEFNTKPCLALRKKAAGIGEIKLRIIHTADLHLDSSMKTYLEGDKAIKRKDELTLNFSRLCENAQDLGVKAIIIAGDLFDTKSVAKKVAGIVLAQINKYRDIQFYYLRGNHDRESFISFIRG